MEIRYWSLPFSKQSRKSCAICIICFAPLVSCFSLANSFNQLKEIGRVGPTVPAQKYYQNVDVKEVKINVEKSTKLLNAAKASISTEMFFPIKPKSMKPGLLTGHRFDSSRAIQPFAVIGSDPLSLKWLNLRKDKLRKLKSPIFVVEANSFKVIKKLASKYKSLNFVPSSGDEIGKGLKVKAYPFLVTSSGVWQ